MGVLFRFGNLKTVKGRLSGAMVLVGLSLLTVATVNFKVTDTIQSTMNWRAASAQGQLIFQNVLTTFRELEREKNGDRRADLRLTLKRRIAEMHSYFDKLLDGDPKKGIPAATDPYIRDAIQATDTFWHDRLSPMLSVARPEKNLATESALNTAMETFTAAIDVGISLSQDVLERKLARLRALQLIVIALGLLIGLRASLFVRKVAKRIETVADIAHQLNNGNWTMLAPETGADELSRLGREFNQMTQKLHREKEFVDDIITSMGEIFILVSKDGSILRINNACMHLSGYEKEDLLGKNIRMLLPDAELFESLMSNITRYGHQRDSSIAFQPRIGGTIPAALAGTAVLDESAQVIGAVLLLKDMTGYNLLLEESRKRAAAEAAAKVERETAEELRLMNEKLKVSQAQTLEAGKFAALGEMAGGIAHEINNPLAIIHGKASLLKDMVDENAVTPVKVREIADKIENTAMRVARIIKGLRTFARDGRNEPAHETPVAQIVSETLDLCREKFKTTGIEVIVTPIPESMVIECRSVQISQVLLNLLNNARDAIEELEKRWIRIEVADLGTSVELAVVDSGPGIPEEVRIKLMQPFFTTKPVGKGTGLGLSISRSIVEGHAGSLRIDAQSPNTRFVITLPRKMPQQQETLLAA